MDTARIQDRWRGVAAWLDASASELAGLVVLLLGAVAVLGVLWWGGRPEAPPQPVSGPDRGSESADGGAGALVGGDTVTVHVAGAVGTPGLVELPLGARVADAIAGAGGLVLDADTSSLNLAREVVDGERIDVGRPGQPGTARADDPSGDGAIGADGVIDLNRATADQLEELPGVGPVLAGRIVDHRDANGPFTEVGQLRDVAGIGEKTFQDLADLVDV